MSPNQPDRTAEVDATGAFRCEGEARPMSAAEKYEFDRLGYLVFRDFLTADEVHSLRVATEKLEAHANAMIAPKPGGEHRPPHKLAPWGGRYHYDPELGYHVCLRRNRIPRKSPPRLLPWLSDLGYQHSYRYTTGCVRCAGQPRWWQRIGD